MHLHVVIGFLESADGPLLGLRAFVEEEVRPRYPGATVGFSQWRDDLPRVLRRYQGQGGPLILLGHSYGGSALVRAVEAVPELTVAHLVLLDPVPRWAWGQFQFTGYSLPGNVCRATCIYNPVSLPKSSPIREIRGRERASWSNERIWYPFHAGIPGSAKVQQRVLEIVAEEAGLQHVDTEVKVAVPPVIVPPRA